MSASKMTKDEREVMIEEIRQRHWYRGCWPSAYNQPRNQGCPFEATRSIITVRKIDDQKTGST